jgi:hypothetical protein
MNTNCVKLLDELYTSYHSISVRLKSEEDPTKLKSLVSEMNKITILTKALTSYINYYKIRNITNK